ncbi:MAG: hypothetical protein R2882_02345 [Gemmatimonadales bacterium]
MQRRASLHALILLAAIGGPAAAQTPRDTVPTVIRAGRLFDSEAGVTGPPGDLVKDGRIAAVGERADRPGRPPGSSI